MADREAFLKEIWPLAVQEGARIGVDPRIIAAQAALESNYGKSAPGNNYYGIKSHGKKGGNTLATTEVVDGQQVRTNASFRAYPDMASSVSGYADFIAGNPRYAGFREAEGLPNEVAALQASGYATDPNYGAKVGRIAGGIDPSAYGMPQPPEWSQQFQPPVQTGDMPAPPQWAQQYETTPPQGDPAQAAEQMAGAGPTEITIRPDGSGMQQPQQTPEAMYSEMVGRDVYGGGGGMYYFDDPMSKRAIPVNSDPRVLALVNAIKGGGNGAA